MYTRLLMGLLAGAPGLLLLPARLQAQDVRLTLGQPIQTAVLGATVTFSGILQNTGAQALFLNGTNPVLYGTGLSLDDSPFFNNAPFSLAAAGDAGDTYSGDLFDVLVAPDAATGDFFGSFAVLGGTDSGTQDSLAAATFQVRVTPAGASVPEPGTLATSSCGLAAVALCAWRRHRAGRTRPPRATRQTR